MTWDSWTAPSDFDYYNERDRLEIPPEEMEDLEEGDPELGTTFSVWISFNQDARRRWHHDQRKDKDR